MWLSLIATAISADSQTCACGCPPSSAATWTARGARRRRACAARARCAVRPRASGRHARRTEEEGWGRSATVLRPWGDPAEAGAASHEQETAHAIHRHRESRERGRALTTHAIRAHAGGALRLRSRDEARAAPDWCAVSRPFYAFFQSRTYKLPSRRDRVRRISGIAIGRIGNRVAESRCIVKCDRCVSVSRCTLVPPAGARPARCNRR